MIKALYLRSSFDPGGTESLLLYLFNYPQNEIQFHYAFLKDGSLISKLKSDTNCYYKLFRRKKIDFQVIKKLARIIRDNNIFIVHTHQLFELFYAVILKMRFPQLKLFHTIHGYHDKHSRWAEILEQLLVWFTHRTFTVSMSSREELKKRGFPSQRIEVLYNAVKPPIKASEQQLEWFKKKIKYHQNDFIVGMIGNFVWGKDQMTLVKAYQLLKEELPDLKIVFIGRESEFSEKCKKELNPEDLNKRVFFLGALENASGYLSLFHLFVMSTLMDTFGIVVIEALMSRIPVLASDIEVMKELSCNGKYFELFEKQNALDLSHQIIKLHNRENKDKIIAALEYAKYAFSYKQYIKNLKNKYIESK